MTDCDSRKQGFVYEHQAYDAMVHSQASERATSAHNFYQCTDCGLFHLTSIGKPHLDLLLPKTLEKIKRLRLEIKYSRFK